MLFHFFLPSLPSKYSFYIILTAFFLSYVTNTNYVVYHAIGITVSWHSHTPAQTQHVWHHPTVRLHHWYSFFFSSGIASSIGHKGSKLQLTRDKHKHKPVPFSPPDTKNKQSQFLGGFSLLIFRLYTMSQQTNHQKFYITSHYHLYP